NGDYLLVAKIKRPFSHLIPADEFPEDIEIWNRRGEVIRKIADMPTREGVPINGVVTGPREHQWRQDQPGTVVWVEALDGGDLKNKVPFRDKVMTLAAPFTGALSEMSKTEWRYSGLSFTEKGVGLLSEYDRTSRHVRTWLLEPGAQPRKLWDRRQDAAYENPGTPVTRGEIASSGFGGAASKPIIQNGNYIYLTGQGSSPEGDRPFIDRLNLKTLDKERLFRSDAKSYENVVAPLDDDAKIILTRYETPADTPNYYVRDLPTNGQRAVTDFKDPQ